MKKLLCDWCGADMELAAHLIFAPVMEAGHQQTHEMCCDCEAIVRVFIQQQQQRKGKCQQKANAQ